MNPISSSYLQGNLGEPYFIGNKLLEKKALSRNTFNLIGSLSFLEITVPHEVPSENILVGTPFLAVISRRFQGNLFYCTYFDR
jgi:hypothetical protein